MASGTGTRAEDSMPAPSVRSLVALLVLVVVATGAGLVLFLATPVAQRPDVWGNLPLFLPYLAVGIPALWAALGFQKVKAQNAKQSEHLAVIRRNTNGVLDARIRDGVRAVLLEAGILPVGEHPPVTPEPDPDPVD